MSIDKFELRCNTCRTEMTAATFKRRCPVCGNGTVQETECTAVGALIIEALQTLRSDAAFLRHYLENYTVSVQTKDERGYVVNGFMAAQIPTWAVRQRLEDIDHAIAALVQPRKE